MKLAFNVLFLVILCIKSKESHEERYCTFTFLPELYSSGSY
jgi:hypothetical protein